MNDNKYQLRKGDKIYYLKTTYTNDLKRIYEIKEVEVYDLYLERYISGSKLIIKIVDDKILLTFFSSELGYILFWNKKEAEDKLKELEGK